MNISNSNDEIEKMIDALGTLIQFGESCIEDVFIQFENKKITPSEEEIVIILLFRKIVEKLDCIFVLSENAALSGVNSILRDLFENMLYFLYIIDKDDKLEFRAMSYYVGHLRNKLEVNKLLSKQSKYSKELRKKYDLTRESLKEGHIEDNITHLKTRLNRSKLKRLIKCGMH
jgi:hypothetical protein